MLRTVIFTISDCKETPASKQSSLNVEMQFNPAIKEGQPDTPATELALKILETVRTYMKENKAKGKIL